MTSGQYRAQFHIPQVNGKDSIYLCGNSLGLQPRKVKEYVNETLEDWASLGVEGHLHARHPWLPYHEFLTQSTARLVGANTSEVVVMNSLTVNLHLLMASFYKPTPERYKILIESDAFPSDRYAVASQAKWHGYDEEDAIILWRPKPDQHLVDLEELEDILRVEGEQIALILVGGVNYYTGQYLNIPEITRLGHEHDIIVGFDLAHATGNVDMQLHDWDVDFAAWCSYKYLNSGPGSLGGIFIHDRHGEDLSVPRLSGWWGHNKTTRFRMRDEFDPMPGAEGWQLSNPPVLSMAAIKASLDIFAEAGIINLRKKSTALTAYLEYLIQQENNENIHIITPSDPEQRGCQLSIQMKSPDKKLFHFLTEHGVIADWREPDVIRVAPAPLYNTFEEMWKFSHVLHAGLNALN